MHKRISISESVFPLQIQFECSFVCPVYFYSSKMQLLHDNCFPIFSKKGFLPNINFIGKSVD